MRTAHREWEKRVAAWGASGLTCAEYAASIGVAPQTLSAWKSKLKKEKLASTVGPGGDGPDFVEVTAAAVEPRAVMGELELCVGAITIRVRGRVDASTLSSVLDVLEGRR